MCARNQMERCKIVEPSSQNREKSKRDRIVFYKLFNSENPRDQLDEIANTEGPVEYFSSGQLKKQMANMRKEKHADQMNSLYRGNVMVEYKPECIMEAFINILKTK